MLKSWFRGLAAQSSALTPASHAPVRPAADAGRAASVQAEVEALLHETAERWNSQDFASVLGLWDPDEPRPFYLAEEQPGWFLDWDSLRRYLAPATPSPAVQGIREEMHDITVKEIAPGIAVAAWLMHFEMKIIGRPPLGEDIRVSAVLRKTKDGWRYLHWAESPMTAPMYLAKLMERDVDHEKFQPCHDRAMAKARKHW